MRISYKTCLFLLAITIYVVASFSIAFAEISVQSIGVQSAKAGQKINNPYKITISSKGFLYLADTGNNSIKKMDGQGNLILNYGSRGSSDGQFLQPQGIAVDSLGNIYVADTGNHRVQKLFDDGAKITFVKSFSTLSDGSSISYPRSVKVDDNDNLYIVDASNKVIRMTTDEAVSKIGREGAKVQGVEGEEVPEEMAFPYGTDIDSRMNIYIADTSNHCIKKYSQEGNIAMVFGRYGRGDGQLLFPCDVAVATDGYIYVADTGNHRIVKFDDRGKFVANIGSMGQGLNKFIAPRGVFVDNVQGYLYVVSADNKIQKYDIAIRLSNVSVSISGSTAGEMNTVLFSCKFSVPEDSIVQFNVYDGVGNFIKHLAERAANGAETMDIEWDGKDEKGEPISDKEEYMLRIGGTTKDGLKSIIPYDFIFAADLKPPVIYDFYTSSRYYSPEIAGDLDITFKVADGGSSELSGVTAGVYDNKGSLIKSVFSTATAECRKFDLAWDGKDASGEIPPDGKYVLVVKAIDKVGNLGQAAKVVVIDSTKPRIEGNLPSMMTITPTGGGMNNFLNFYYKIVDAAPEITTQLKIKTLAGASIKTYSYTGAPREIFETWDGRDELNHVITDGQYKYEISAIDSAGNESDVKSGDIVSIINPTIIADASPKIISPNGDFISDSITITYSIDYRGMMSGDSNIIIEVLDKAETQIYYFSDTKSQGDYSHIWSGQKSSGGQVADGVYTLRITANDPAGVLYSFQTLIMVDTTPPTITGLTMEAGGVFKTSFNPYVDNSITIEFVPYDNSLTFPIECKVNLTAEVWYGYTKIATLITNEAATGETKTIKWAGLNNSGDYVNEGSYQLKISLTDMTGNSTACSSSIVLDDDQRITNTTPVPVKNENGDATSPQFITLNGADYVIGYTEGWNSEAVGYAETGVTVRSDSGGPTARSRKHGNQWFYVNNDGAPVVVHGYASPGTLSYSFDLDYASAYGVGTWPNIFHRNGGGFFGVSITSPTYYLNTGWYHIHVYISRDSWSSRADGYTEAWFRVRKYQRNSAVSSDYGATWAKVPIGETETPPSVLLGATQTSIGSTIHKIYTTYDNGYTNLYYQRSTNGGGLWSTSCKLTHSSNVYNPTITCEADGDSYVAWEDTRDNHKEIYYQKIPYNFAPVNSSTMTIMKKPVGMAIFGGAVVMSGISTPELISPVGGTTVASLRPTFKWYGLSGWKYYMVECAATSDADALSASSDRYDLTIDDEMANQVKPLCEFTQSEHYMGLDESDANRPYWYWRVRTTNTSEVTTSEVGSFRIELPVSLSGVTNWPNPFNPNKEVTKIRYRLGRQADSVNIRIYDITGALVRELDGTCNAEQDSVWNKYNDVAWDGRNGRGDMVLNGVYPFEVTVSCGSKSVTGRGKAVVLK
jgi:flagellar hook assembly protein FlgD/sugar lactone lactonase YvrE